METPLAVFSFNCKRIIRVIGIIVLYFNFNTFHYDLRYLLSNAKFVLLYNEILITSSIFNFLMDVMVLNDNRDRVRDFLRIQYRIRLSMNHQSWR